MAVKYGKFEMPEKVKIEEEKENFARFVAEPFERGFGHTLGNAYRRILLTALESPAIISFKMEGIHHEYSVEEGIVEDFTNIILNLKNAKLKTFEEEYSREIRKISHTLEVTQKDIDQAGGMFKVTLKDIFPQEMEFEILNKDALIMTVTKPLKKRVDFKIGFGRGYVPSEKLEGIDKLVDEILLDVSYSPVVLVNYFVENTRVGQHTDYDKLILEVTTDGRITPQEALSFATQIAMKHFEIFDKFQNISIDFDKEIVEENRVRDELLDKLSLKIGEIELSVRSTNCLAGANIKTIGELIVIPEAEMLKFRNFGKKSLTEIKQKLADMELGLGMDLSKYGINRENIAKILKEHLEAQKNET